ncbi:MAG: hypothetical protein BroJett030_14870 [Alphaproteobacteria bacterium]|nr:MAG: hypothetical protein BroJett030_14870 [Alphaproteobacteria bacterium]
MIVIMFDALFDALGRHAATTVSLDAGATLFCRGDPVTSLYLVIAGAVDLVRHLEDGRAVVLQKATARSILAEASLYSRCYHCDCVGTEAARLLSVPVGRARQLLHDDERLATLWPAYLAGELQAARHRCEMLTRRRVGDRLAAWLDWNGSLPSKGQWHRLAAELGVSPEALYREIARRKR